MKFYLSTYETGTDFFDVPYIQARYSIHNNPGFLDICLNVEIGKSPIEIILNGLCKLYKTDEITMFYKNMMYKTCNGYYQEYKRY